MRKLFTFLLATFMLGVFGVNAVEYERTVTLIPDAIVNPTFDNDLTGWTLQDGIFADETTMTPALETNRGRTGKKSIYFNLPSGTQFTQEARVYQSITLLEGEYELVAYKAYGRWEAANGIFASVSGQPDVKGSGTNSTTTFTEQRIVFEVPADGAVTIGGYASSRRSNREDYFWLDDFELYKVTYKEITSYNYDELNTKIIEAQNLYNSATSGTATLEYQPAAFDPFNEAITTASALIDNAESQAQINDAVINLQGAIDVFVASQNKYFVSNSAKLYRIYTLGKVSGGNQGEYDTTERSLSVGDLNSHTDILMWSTAQDSTAMWILNPAADINYIGLYNLGTGLSAAQHDRNAKQILFTEDGELTFKVEYRKTYSVNSEYEFSFVEGSRGLELRALDEAFYSMSSLEYADRERYHWFIEEVGAIPNYSALEASILNAEEFLASVQGQLNLRATKDAVDDAIVAYQDAINKAKMSLRTANQTYVDEAKISIDASTVTFRDIMVATSIDSSEIQKEVASTEYFDLTGKKVSENVEGFVIVKTIYVDGSVKNEKVFK